MKITIHRPRTNAKRIKCHIPWELHEWRSQFKMLKGSWYHPSQKLWSIPNTTANWTHLTTLFCDQYTIVEATPAKQLPNYTLDQEGLVAVDQLRKTLTLKGYAPSTIKMYCSHFGRFVHDHHSSELSAITKENIEDYIYQLIQENSISEIYQNAMINSIKAYYEHVLDMPRTVYVIQRPKKNKTIPGVLTQQEVKQLLNAVHNMKHKTILMTIYSAGLRISEAVTLRIEDVHSKEGYLFIKSAKGKKDRKTILSPLLTEQLRQYYTVYKPSYWLFEGQSGGQYSKSSITKIFRKACVNANINPWATVHTLRHSFATHLVQQGTNLRYIQNMLGHESPKTNEIYTKTKDINNQTIKSPLDTL
ncbi:MAG: tyrosine-type recombinase/integrase [Bacteroidota bacterium]